MKSVIGLAAIAAFTTASLHGQTLDWDFSYSGSDGANAPSYTYTAGGQTVTVTGFVLPDTGGSPVFEPADLKLYDNMIAMERPGDDHRVDNDGGDEFVVLTFSSPMSNLEVKTLNYWETADRDVEYWFASPDPAGGLSLTGLGLGDLAGAGFTYGGIIESTGNPGGEVIHQLTTPVNGITALIFGPPSGQDNDAFKLGGVSSILTVPAPEPSASLFVAGAAGLMALRRRRRA